VEVFLSWEITSDEPGAGEMLWYHLIDSFPHLLEMSLGLLEEAFLYSFWSFSAVYCKKSAVGRLLIVVEFLMLSAFRSSRVLLKSCLTCR
jgi:hypothetical protein